MVTGPLGTPNPAVTMRSPYSANNSWSGLGSTAAHLPLALPCLRFTGVF